MINVTYLGKSEAEAVIWFKFNGAVYGVDHSGDIVDCEGCSYDVSPFVVELNQDCENETTEYNFPEHNFKFLDNNGQVSLELDISGEDIKEARKLMFLTQSEFAMRLGWTSKRQVVKLEKNKVKCTTQTALAIEALLKRENCYDE